MNKLTSTQLRKFYLILLLNYLFLNASAQIIPSASLPPWNLNTGVDQNFNPIPYNAQDMHWEVSLNGSPFVKAVKCMPNGCFWSPENNSYFSAWITHPLLVCGSPPATSNWNCASTAPTLIFRCTFNLNSPIFRTDMYAFADGWISQVRVNGNTAFPIPAPSPFAPPPTNHMNSATRISWCWDWIVGQNKIEIEVHNSISKPMQCRFTGLKVENYGSAYPNITGPISVCTGTSYNYSLPPSSNPAMGYQWTRPPGWSNQFSSGPNILKTIAGTINGTVGVTTYMNTGSTKFCYSTSGLSVTADPQLTITPWTSTAVCPGQPILICGYGGGAPNTYTWTTPNYTYSPPNQCILETPTVSKTFTLWATTPKSGCLYKKTQSIVVYPPVSVTTSVNPSPVCYGYTAQLTANGSPASYSWKLLTNGPNPSIPGNPITVLPTNQPQEMYEVTATSVNGCTATAQQPVNILPTPVDTILTNDTIICQGATANLQTKNPQPGYSYSWSPTGTIGPFCVDNPTITTTYSLYITSPNGCVGKAVKTVTVISTPTISVFPARQCTGIPNLLTATGAGNYTWSYGPPTTVIQNTNNISVILPPINTVQVCGSTTGCNACTTISVPRGFPVNITSSSQTLCTSNGACVTLTASSTTPATSFTWRPSANTGSTELVCPNATTIYTVEADSPLGCPNVRYDTVFVTSNCCSLSTTGIPPITASGGNFANGSFLINNPITLNNSTTFQDADIWITPNGKITVPQGVTLDLEHAHLYSCSNSMWQGIEVKDGGRLVTNAISTSTSSSMIEDALIGVDLSNISTTNSGAVPPLDINRVIFNKNFIGIRIANSDTLLDTLALGISGCVFTSRQISFTSGPGNQPFSWPFAVNQVGGLRAATNPTTGLANPYLLMGFSPSNLKLPYNNQPGHIGIQIEKIGGRNNSTFSMWSPSGIQFNITYPGVGKNDFNLFEGIGKGIEVTDAGLTTKNNVFQNMVSYSYSTSTGKFGGTGVDSKVTDLRNVRLSMKGTAFDDGCRFWNCITGVNGENVMDCWINYATFRSTHNVNTATSTNGNAGDTAIRVNTNRFVFTVQNSQFNNVKKGIYFTTPAVTQPFQFNSISTNTIMGILPSHLLIQANYFGACENSTVAYTTNSPNSSQYLSDAVTLITPNPQGWTVPQNLINTMYIVNNKIDRAFRGIWVEGFEDMETEIAGNHIYLEEDFTYGAPAFGYGVGAKDKTDSLAVTGNTVVGNIATSQGSKISSIYCEQIGGMYSPSVTCNFVDMSHYGFEFKGWNGSAYWRKNTMCNNFGGLALTANGVIGPQGDPQDGMGNIWSIFCSFLWPGQYGINHTYCDNSNPMLSPLFCRNSPGAVPLFNGSFQNGALYTYNASYFDNSNTMPDCLWSNSYNPAPTWRSQNTGERNGIKDEGETPTPVKIFPNPANEEIRIVLPDNQQVSELVVYNSLGLLVKTISLTEKYTTVKVGDLLPGLYIFEVHKASNQYRFKIIIKN